MARNTDANARPLPYAPPVPPDAVPAHSWFCAVVPQRCLVIPARPTAASPSSGAGGCGPVRCIRPDRGPGQIGQVDWSRPRKGLPPQADAALVPLESQRHIRSPPPLSLSRSTGRPSRGCRVPESAVGRPPMGSPCPIRWIYSTRKVRYSGSGVPVKLPTRCCEMRRLSARRRGAP